MTTGRIIGEFHTISGDCQTRHRHIAWDCDIHAVERRTAHHQASRIRRAKGSIEIYIARYDGDAAADDLKLTTGRIIGEFHTISGDGQTRHSHIARDRDIHAVERRTAHHKACRIGCAKGSIKCNAGCHYWDSAADDLKLTTGRIIGEFHCICGEV